MTIREIIESGIIELYVMNALPAEESAQVEAWAGEFPEVRAEIEAIEISLEKYAQDVSITPRPELKEEIIKRFESEMALKQPKTPDNTPLSNSVPSKGFSSLWAWVLAGLSILGSVFMFVKNQSAQKTITECAAENERLVAQQRKDVADLQSKINIMRSPTTKTVKLAGQAISKESEVLVYWNAAEKTTLLTIRNLPAPPKGKQYQLWAIVNKKPVDAGVFNYDVAAIQNMKAFDQAELFAVTLENEGGSVEPTLEQMYVAGAPL
jgi:anti-sigma-K factor RskA